MVRYALDTNDIIRRYTGGESEKALADALGVSRPTIRRRLLEAGVKPRGGHESALLIWQQRPLDERPGIYAAAHAASRGKVQTVEHRTKIATTRATLWNRYITPGEDRLWHMLRDRGLYANPQQAVGPYNCDLGAWPVAVEIFGGNGHWYGRHIERTAERFHYLFERGWHIIVVHTGPDYPLDPVAADYIVAFHKQASSNPAAVREYRVIRGNGQLRAAGRADDDEFSIVETLGRRRHPAQRLD